MRTAPAGRTDEGFCRYGRRGRSAVARRFLVLSHSALSLALRQWSRKGTTLDLTGEESVTARRGHSFRPNGRDGHSRAGLPSMRVVVDDNNGA